MGPAPCCSAGRRGAWAAAAAGALCALVPALLLYGFTVDDALIPARYAAHLARGLGYRFNAGGPVTDGVTPLGFPYLLAPFAHEGPIAALGAAKVLGVASWTLAAAVLGVAVYRLGRARLRWCGLLLVLGSSPLAAWSASGLETGIATALAALGVALPELGLVRVGAAAAGLAAGLRPELLPWALVVAAAPAPRGSGPPFSFRQTGARIALAAAPFVIVVCLRAAIFGRVVPLSVLAKPSDFAHGALYAAKGLVFTGPLAVVAPVAWRRLDGWGRGLAASVLVHLAAIAFAGGDWMVLFRLLVPILPTVALAAAHLAEVAGALATATRMVLVLAGQAVQAAGFLVQDGAGVGAHRRALVEEIRPALSGAKVVAALDVGWVGAATDATLVDLAGLTDPAIAALPGGHTSKAIPARLLDARGVDAIVLLLLEGRPLADPWNESYFARRVELRVSELPGIGNDFEVVAESRAPHLHYVVVRRPR